jgi:hypothetical protein
LDLPTSAAIGAVRVLVEIAFLLVAALRQKVRLASLAPPLKTV